MIEKKQRRGDAREVEEGEEEGGANSLKEKKDESFLGIRKIFPQKFLGMDLNAYKG